MAKKYEEYLAELGVGNGMPTAAEVGQQIMGREPFKYDVNTDELYKQYMDKYSALGKKAMEDTIGKSTALTGGYANSYAQVAGQQAYNDYMSKASDMIPELYVVDDYVERVYLGTIAMATQKLHNPTYRSLGVGAAFEA